MRSNTTSAGSARSGRLSHHLAARLFLVAIVSVGTACGDDPLSANDRVANIERISGDSASFLFGWRDSLTVTGRVTDASGNPVAGATVNLSDPLRSEYVLSDAQGLVTVRNWKPAFVGWNDFKMTSGHTTTTFSALGLCAPTSAVTVGVPITGGLTNLDCHVWDWCVTAGDQCDFEYQDHYTFTTASAVSLCLRVSTNSADEVRLTVFDALSQKVASIAADTPRLWVSLPPGSYDIEVRDALGWADEYTLAVEAASSEAECLAP